MRHSMKVCALILVLMAPFYLLSQVPEWIWDDAFGNPIYYNYPASSFGYGITVDTNQNTYVSGMIMGTHDIHNRGYPVVAKYDQYGTRLWIKEIGGSSLYGTPINDVIADSLGNVYVAGTSGSSYTEQGIFMPSGPFVAKIDSTGTLLWVRGVTMAGDFKRLALDSMGILSMIGDFTGTATFGSGSISTGSSLIRDIFFAKISQSGDWMQYYRLGCSQGYSGSLQYDDDDNLYITGQFSGSFFSLTSISTSDIFVIKRRNNGTWAWAVRAGGSSDNNCNSITVDDNQCVYITGRIGSNASFGDFTLSGICGFVAKLSSTGEWIWVNGGGHNGFGVEIDNNNNLLVACNFSNTITVNSTILNGHPSGDIFIACIDLSGNWIWVKQGFLIGRDFTIDAMGNGYVTGISRGGGQTLVKVAKLGYVVPPTVLLLSQVDCNFGTVIVEGISPPQTASILNYGNQDLVISNIYTTNNLGQFQFDHTQLPITVSSGNTASISISFLPQTVGIITDTLVVVNNSINNPELRIVLRGRGAHAPLTQPENVNITMNGYNAEIEWDSVTQDINGHQLTPDYYFVWFNGLDSPTAPFYFLAPTTTNNYVHHGVALGAQHMYYKVTAVKLYRDEYDSIIPSDDIIKTIRRGMTMQEVESTIKQSTLND